jgi:uncharacterized protein YyaL (SSP411 family)
MVKEFKHTNQLVHETSPYLLQHAHNPVDWYPWGEEALNRAKSEDKPILLSIGYSACHWCHVMERECFEDGAIAQTMNERFVNIKVDREERPDLDEIYMNAAQVMTGGGGWPLNVFLTPDLIPFHAGTYFPPEDRGEMPGFQKILKIVSDYYQTHRGEVSKINTQLRQTLHEITHMVPSQVDLDLDVLTKAYDALEKQFDPSYGGFGRAPKFPSSLALSFLLRYWKRAASDHALEMVEATLQKMANGGIYDQLGGGFHRYSVDERWLVPHFEKMLYDNALLTGNYCEAYQVTGRERYRRIAEEILNYVLREMTSPRGGFYSAQDADSEGEEGKFYVWTRDQIKKVLGKDEGTPFCAYYGVTPQGNFEGRSSILHVASSLEKVSELYGLTSEALGALLEEGRRKLLAERDRRVKPNRDDKVLVSWNGLMISGFVDGYRVTSNAAYLEGATKAARFILGEMMKGNLLMRTHNQGQSRLKAYSEDYAFFIQALIDLYEVSFDIEWLKQADRLNGEMIRQFWDEEAGGFFFTGKENEPLIAQSKNPYDNVLPSPNSVGVFNLIRLGYLTGDESLKQKAERTLRLFYRFLSEHPAGFSHMLSGLIFFSSPEEIGIIGSREDEKTNALLRAVHLTYLPNRVLNLRDPRVSVGEKWFPFLADKGAQDVPIAYVCKEFTCLPPAMDEQTLRKILSG